MKAGVKISNITKQKAMKKIIVLLAGIAFLSAGYTQTTIKPAIGFI
jgi:hypothetical protein